VTRSQFFNESLHLLLLTKKTSCFIMQFSLNLCKFTLKMYTYITSVLLSLSVILKYFIILM